MRASFAIAMVLACASATDLAQAQGPRAQQRIAAQQQALRGAHNARAILIATSHPRQSYAGIAMDIAAMLGERSDFRVIPVMGDGGSENIKDLLYLRGVDLAIVPSNVLLNPKTADPLGGGLQAKLAYVANLYGEEVHLLAGRGIGSVAELAGKAVAVPIADSNAMFSAADILKRLGIRAEIVRMDPVSALDQIRSGEVAAALLVGGKPLSLVAGLPKDGSVRLLSIRSTLAIEEGYAPAALRAEDYPALIPPDGVIDTVSVSAILLARQMKDDDEAQGRLDAFVPLFFDGLTNLTGPPRHPKWADVNLGAALSGWTRFSRAQLWLDNAKNQQAAWLQKSFEDFLSTSSISRGMPLSPAQRQKLFDEFVSWARRPAQPSRQ